MEMLGGKYRIEHIAGSGGFGDVYRGYDTRMERPVAIKSVSRISDNEAYILRSLEHQGLPCLYDYICDGDKSYLIMEWIDGINLEEYINTEGAMSEEKATRIGMELLDIMEYLHSRTPAIVYQDLKPANIMLRPDGHIKLIDFGTALILSHNDEASHTAGTIGYGSPEQRGLHGQAYADVRSDIYAWGAVMYSLLSGRNLSRPPYVMSHLREVCPQISFGLEHVINKATKHDAENRYDSVQSVKQSLLKGPLRDYIAKVVFIFSTILCICPLLYCWYLAYSEGLFSHIEAYLLSIKSLWRSGIYLAFLSRLRNLCGVFAIMKQHTSQADIDRYHHLIGLILLSSAWFIMGTRLLGKRRFIRTNRSVYLSDRIHPGLWISSLIAGILFGYGLGGNTEAIVSYAASTPSIQATSNNLPVSVCTSSGETLLVNYSSAYQHDGSLHLMIDASALDNLQDDSSLELILNTSDGVYSRRLYVQ